LYKGCEFVVIAQQMIMFYFSFTEWIVNIFATCGTISLVQLFPDDLLLECGKGGQWASYELDDIPFIVGCRIIHFV